MHNRGIIQGLMNESKKWHTAYGVGNSKLGWAHLAYRINVIIFDKNYLLIMFARAYCFNLSDYILLNHT